MLALLGALYLLAPATRRLFLSGVLPIADEEAPPSMWMLRFSSGRWKTSRRWALPSC
jgi:hypothetical protein